AITSRTFFETILVQCYPTTPPAPVALHSASIVLAVTACTHTSRISCKPAATLRVQWRITIVRTQGMRFMRPERSWRPIIIVAIDKYQSHEIVMGVDGQNPDLKQHLEVHPVQMTSQVNVQVWHQSQTKKKKKKRNLVASSSLSFAELLRQLRTENKSGELSLPLRISPTRRGKSLDGASLLLRVNPPEDVRRNLLDIDASESTSLVCESGKPQPVPSSRKSTIQETSDISSPITPLTPVDDLWPNGSNISRLRRRRGPGYHLSSDDGFCSSLEDGFDDHNSPDFSDGCSFSGDDAGDVDFEDDTTLLDDESLYAAPGTKWIQVIWSSILPQNGVSTIEVPLNMTVAERMLASFTAYRELKEATLDSQFEKVFTQLQTEWTYVGGVLAGLAAVSTSVFAIAPEAIVKVESSSRSAIAASSVSAGLGIACDSWFILRYNWADMPTFRRRAQDVYSSFFFFALSARMPALCIVISSFSLMVFMALIAFEVWPVGMLMMCFGMGLVMTLQFLVYGVHMCTLWVLGAARWIKRAGRKLLGQEILEGSG
ncbi:hypothetical protein DXG01_012861, partial [Tephrocybe rancida]